MCLLICESTTEFIIVVDDKITKNAVFDVKRPKKK